MACCMEGLELIFQVIANKVKQCLGLITCMGHQLMMVSVA